MSVSPAATVMKFGGTSVGDVAAFERVVHVVSTQSGRRPVVVVSAMTRVTDVLLEAFETAKKSDLARAIALLEPHFERHVEVARHFIPEGSPDLFNAELQFARGELSDLLMRAARRSLPLSMLRDAIVSYGEQLSSRLLAEVLRAKGVNARHFDSRRLIVTDDEYGAAQPIMDETTDLVRLDLRPAIAAGEVPVMGGFIAGNRAGETTTLGRGGSDFSAALVAAALDADELQIWTDVTGVMTCDPRICSEARTIPLLSYEEAAELAYFGAKVLHPKTIKPAVDHGIPVRVCNTFEPDAVGTMVVAESGEAPNKIKSIAHKKGITILRITSARMLGSFGFMSAVFQVFDRYRTVIDVISTSEVSIALTLDNTASLDKIVEELSRLGDVEVESGYAVICVVGEGLRASTGLASKIFSTIHDVHVELVSHGASAVNLTFVVRDDDAAGAIKKLHKEFF
ncbi:MAG TPA: lysine-sensitive aspartokinase 3 [Pyrinomonadaceae bacterium]|nr:lysine-sensitive aspartokinase 3 [Pyrinomonadaceae bacterium]HMP63986.1 lysine-sensitive aspartokinase 3 [Pyrinomonadaceae bacterium]